MKKQLHLLSCLLFCIFAVTTWGQTSFTITYTGLGGTGTTGAVVSPTNLFTVALTNTTAYNGVDATCATSTDGATSYTTTIAAKAGYNFTITSVSGSAYASSAGYKGYQVQISSSNSNFTTSSSTVGCIGTSSNCGTASATGTLTGNFTTTAGNSCTITVLKSKCGSESGGGYSKTKTLVISGTYIAVATGATKLAFSTVPTTGTVGVNLGTITVQAQKSDNSVDNTYTSNITIAKATGTGTISGTLTKAAVNGVATFTDIQFNAASTYTISATSGSLTSATSGNIVVSSASSATDYFRSKASGNWGSASTWQSSTNGSSNWIDATLTPTSSANTISIQAGHTVTAAANISVSNINIVATGVLNVAPATVITVPSGKTIVNNGTFTLKSDVTGTASIGNSAGTITGNVTIERFIDGGASNGTPGKRAFRFLSHPFSNYTDLRQLTNQIDITGSGATAIPSAVNFTQSGSNAPSAFWFDPMLSDNASNDAGWQAFTNALPIDANDDNAWKAGQGIRVLVRGTKGEGLIGTAYTASDVTLSMNGAVNIATAPIVTPLLTNGQEGTGWNLVGNPLPSAIEIQAKLKNLRIADIGGDNSNIGAVAYVWNPNKTASTRGGYEAIDLTAASNYYLPMSGVVLVQTIINNNSALSFSESDKSTNTPVSLFRTNGTGNAITLQLEDEYGTDLDKTHIRFNNKASINFESNDGGKMLNEYSLYSLTSNNIMAYINTQPVPSIDSRIQLGMYSSQPKNFLLKVMDLDLPIGTTAYLKDNFLNTQVAITDVSFTYAFSTTNEAASKGNNRFELLFKKGGSALPVQEPSFMVKLSPNPATDILDVSFTNKQQARTTITITNLEGKILQTVDAGNVQSGKTSINVKKYSKGSYYVTLNNGTENRTEKLQIQ